MTTAGDYGVTIQSNDSRLNHTSAFTLIAGTVCISMLTAMAIMHYV